MQVIDQSGSVNFVENKLPQKIVVFRFFYLPFSGTASCDMMLDAGGWNGDMMPTLGAALLCSSRAGSDLGRLKLYSIIKI